MVSGGLWPRIGLGPKVHSSRGKDARAGQPSSRWYRHLHHSVHGCSRLIYSEILDDEKKNTAAGFWTRAGAFSTGIGVSVDAVMTDTGACYRSRDFRRALEDGLRHKRTRSRRGAELPIDSIPHRQDPTKALRRMTTPPYTLQSFVRLAESDNRRGNDLSRQDRGVRRATRQLSNRRKQYLRDVPRYPTGSTARAQLRETYREDRGKLRKARDEAVEDALQTALSKFDKHVEEDSFELQLARGSVVKGKQTYKISRDLSITFPAKEAGKQLHHLSHVDHQSRNSIIRALQSALERPYPHAILKTDIKNFFESIPHDNLKTIITQAGLDSLSYSIVTTLLDEYNQLTNSASGLPRGVGLSSHLAESYLTDFDISIKSRPGVIFYARYVDDLIMVLEDESILTTLKQHIKTELADKGLQINKRKTLEIVSDEHGNYPTGTTVNYLGYQFKRANNTLATGLTQQRRARRENRLKIAFKAWLESKPSQIHPNHGHNGLLLNRVRYLAGNTKLLNSKANVAIGLYFSNSSLDREAEELKELDKLLRTLVILHRSKMTQKLHKRLKAISFVDMFSERTFLRLSPKSIEKIVKIW